MSKLAIIYGTGSHNTERMAIAIEEGARAEGIETILENVDLKINIGLAFGSYGLSLEATQMMNKLLTSYGIEMIEDLLVKRMPGEKELELCRRVGTLLACIIKNKEVLRVA